MNTLPEPLNPKKDLGRFSASCFTYSIVMLVVVILYTVFSYFFVLFQQGFDIGKTEEFVKSFMDKDGGSYIIASCLGVLIFTIFRGKQLFTRDLRKKNKKMTAKVFFFMICFLFFSQLFSTVTSQIMNAILSLFGLDLSEILSQALIQSPCLSIQRSWHRLRRRLFFEEQDCALWKSTEKYLPLS